MHYLTTRIEFSAYHKLWNPNFTPQQNEEVYEECSRGHGHNYIVEVTVKGNADPQTGMVMDLKKLNRLIKQEIYTYCDHKNLNQDVTFLEGVIPTAENLSTVFWKVLAPKIKDANLYRVRVCESQKNVAEYYGDVLN